MSETLDKDLQDTAQFQAQLNGSQSTSEPKPNRAARRQSAKASVEDSALEMSIFEDCAEYSGSETQTYSFELQFGNTSFQCDQLTQEEIAHFIAEQETIQADSKSIVSIQDDNDKLKATQDIAARIVEMNTSVVLQAVKGWKNPKAPNKVPCTDETKRKLTVSIRAALASEILARSMSGIGGGSFLGR